MLQPQEPASQAHSDAGSARLKPLDAFAGSLGQKVYQTLREAILSVEASYDLVFIDCPPQLGFLTLSSLVASSSIIIPVVPNFIDVASLAQFLTMTSSLLDTIRDAGMTLIA